MPKTKTNVTILFAVWENPRVPIFVEFGIDFLTLAFCCMYSMPTLNQGERYAKNKN